MTEARFTCPCCGHRTLGQPPGSFEMCEVCHWEDDPVQLLDPAYRGGANGPSLMECQQNFARVGASEDLLVGRVRPPEVGEERDPEWRPAQESDLRFSRLPPDLSDEEYERKETWYYWKRRAT